MINSNEINKSLDIYLDGNTIKDFSFLKSLNTIVLNNTFYQKEADYTEKISIEESIDLVYSFLKELDNNYALYFETRIDSGDISFSTGFKQGSSYYDKRLKRKRIEVPIKYSIDDAYCLVHELFHDMNLEPLDLGNETRLLTTEAISMLVEFLFKDFLEKYKLGNSDNKKVLINSFSGVYKVASIINLKLKLLDRYFEYGLIGKKYFKYLKKHYENDVIYYAPFQDKNEFSLEFNQRYIIGVLLSTYMYQRIQNNYNSINELKWINNIMHDCKFKDIIKYLGLSIKGDDEYFLLTDSSLEKLEKTYKKVQKEF